MGTLKSLVSSMTDEHMHEYQAEAEVNRMLRDYTTKAGRLLVFTDGSNSLRTGLCGWAVIARWNGQETRACGWAKGTNQFAELYAIIFSLRRLPKNVPITIYSDSEYSIKALTVWRDKWVRNGFKNAQGLPVAYAELVKEGHRLIDGFADISIVHVRGHNGFEGNESADKLAKAARYAGEGRAVEEFPVPATGLVMENGIDSDTGKVYSK